MTASGRNLIRAVLSLSLALVAFAPVARAAKTPANGDLVFAGTPFQNQTQFFLLRAKVPSGIVDTLATLPSGNAPRALSVSPFDGLVYILGSTNMMVVDPCTGIVSTLPTGGAMVNDGIWVHSNGSIYWARNDGKIYRVDRHTGSFTQIANVVTTYGVSADAVVEGSDHQLYIATGTSTAGMQPWVVRMDPITGVSQIVASFNIQSTNVRALAFDTRDSLYVLRVGFNQIVHRVDRVTGAISPYVTLPVTGVTFGAMAGHPDGNLYIPGSPVAAQYAIYRVDPVTGTATTLVPAQAQLGYFGMAVMRGFSGCPTEAHRSTWGSVKAMYR
jgi:streptogramin lyase